MIDILKLPTAKIRNKCLSEFQHNIKSEMQEQFMWRLKVLFFFFFCCSTRRTSDLSLIVYALWKLHSIGICTSPLPPRRRNALRFAKENSKWTLCSVGSPIRGGGARYKGFNSHHGTFDIAVCIVRCVGWWLDKGPNVYPNICRVEKSRSPPLFYISSPGSNLTLISDRRTISSLVAPLDLYIKSAAVCIRKRPENASRSAKDALRLG